MTTRWVGVACVFAVTLLASCGDDGTERRSQGNQEQIGERALEEFDSPRDRFYADLMTKFDNLILELEELHLGDKSGDALARHGDQTALISAPQPRSMLVISACETVRGQFERVSLEFLEQDVNEFDAWVPEMRDGYSRKLERVREEEFRIKRDFQESPERYNSHMAGSFLIISRGQLFIHHGEFFASDQAYSIVGMVDIDIDLWVAAVREEMLNVQASGDLD